MIKEDLVNALLEYIENEKVVLDEIAKKLGVGADDIVYQFPDSTNALYLDAGATYEKEFEINKKLHYISVDAPDGVLITISKDNMPLFFFIDEVGAIEMQAGISFNNLKIKAVNGGSTSQKWSCRLIFR